MTEQRIALISEPCELLQSLAESVAVCLPGSVVPVLSNALALHRLEYAEVDVILWCLPTSVEGCSVQLHQLRALAKPPAVAFIGATAHLYYLERECQFLEIRYLGNFLLPICHIRLKRMFDALRLGCGGAPS